MNCFTGILADAAPAAPQSPAGLQGIMSSPIPMMVLFGVIFYFILIRPQQQRAKQQRKLLEGIKAGDEVVTAAGIIGTIVTVKDKKVMLRSGDAKFEITKDSITAILEPGTPAKA